MTHTKQLCPQPIQLMCGERVDGLTGAGRGTDRGLGGRTAGPVNDGGPGGCGITQGGESGWVRPGPFYACGPLAMVSLLRV